MESGHFNKSESWWWFTSISPSGKWTNRNITCSFSLSFSLGDPPGHYSHSGNCRFHSKRVTHQRLLFPLLYLLVDLSLLCPSKFYLFSWRNLVVRLPRHPDKASMHVGIRRCHLHELTVSVEGERHGPRHNPWPWCFPEAWSESKTPWLAGTSEIIVQLSVLQGTRPGHKKECNLAGVSDRFRWEAVPVISGARALCLGPQRLSMPRLLPFQQIALPKHSPAWWAWCYF